MITVEKILLEYDPERKNLLPVLQEVNRNFGYVSEEDAKKIAEYFSLSLAQVFEIASFYDLIKTKKQSAVTIRVCSGINCAVGGGKKIAEEVERFFKIKAGDDFNSKIKLETVSCLGECGNGPVMIVNGTVYTNMEAEKVDDILKNYS